MLKRLLGTLGLGVMLSPLGAQAPSFRIDTFAGRGVTFTDQVPATEVMFLAPFGIARDAAGNLYVSDREANRVWKINAEGVASVFGGNGNPGSGGDGGRAVEAGLNAPSGLAIGDEGKVYIAEMSGNRVRQVSADGIITTVAGTGQSGSSGDEGPATEARLNGPAALAYLPDWGLFIADRGNNKVRLVNREGLIVEVLDDPDLNYPSGLAVDGAPSLYIADASHRRILRAQPDKLTVIAGNGELGGDGDGGPATKARFFHPQGVAIDPSGRVLIADVQGHRLRVVGTDGVIDGLAGSGKPGFQGDSGPARQALLSLPQSLVADEQGNVYFVDAGNRRVRKISPDGKIVTIAGADTLATADLQLLAPTGVSVAPSGEVYIADTLNHRAIRLAADGTASVVAGNGSAAFTFDGADGERMLNEPVAIAVSERSVLIADGQNHRIKRVASDGRVSVVAGVGFNGLPTGDGGPATEAHLSMPAGLTVGPSGSVFISERWTHRIRHVRTDGTITTIAGTGEGGYSGDDGPATQARIQAPCGLAIGPDGSLYFADRGNNRVRRITTQGTIETVAGKGQAGYLGDGGPAREALLSGPHGVAFDQKGNLYISEANSHHIRLVTPDGTIYTVAGAAMRSTPGAGGRFQGDGGPATEAQLFQPHGIAVDQSGNVYFADRGNNRIRKLTRVPD